MAEVAMELVGARAAPPPDGPRRRGRFSDLHIQPLPTRGGRRRRYRVLQDFHYTRPNIEVITVPAGFVYDGDSVPRWTGPLYAWLKGRTYYAAAVHDWLYANQAGKEYADRVFLEAMKVEGLPGRWRYPIYWGVKFGGAKAYASHA